MRLDAVDLFVVRLPLVRPFETSFGRLDAREFVLVRAAQDGLSGWGECVADADPYYSSETTVTAWHVLSRHLVPAILAAGLGHPREAHARWRFVRGHRMAKASLEMALWDLAARREGRPLCELLGAAPRPVPAGVSIGIEPSIEALLDRVAEERDAGYLRIKIKIKPGWDCEPVAAIRARFGAIPLMVDANAAYADEAPDALAGLDDFDLTMIEQPLDYDDLVRHARLQAVLRTSLCLDESITGPRAAADAIEIGACRVINIKPGRVGGLAPSMDVHDLARDRQVPVWHGGMLETGIGRAHNLHLSTLPGFVLPGDVAASRRYFDPDLVARPIELSPDGTIAIPPGPGIGVEPDPGRLRETTLQTERFTS
jgi:O-succinylbenzoate synthase